MKKEVIVHKNPKSVVSEIFRTLRTNIQFMTSNKKMKTILITSTLPEEGKSYIAVNLAVTFAQTGKKVLLLDADMRKGRQYSILGLSSKPGLSNYLSGVEGDEDLTKYIQVTEIDNLYFIPAGNVPPNPSELLITDQMTNLLKELKENFDIIVVDGTPCGLVTDAVILSRIMDTTVLVAENNKTKKDNLKETIKKIKNVGGNIAGIVINKVNIDANRYQQAYYYGSTSLNNKSNSSRRRKKK